MALSSGTPGLIGLLETWSAIEVRPTRPDWALHWSAWLGPLDAIALRGALPAITKATKAVALRTAQEPDLSQALQQLRDDVTGFIRQAPVRPVPAQVRVAGIAQAAPEPAEDEDYGSYRQRYLDIQRRMDLRIGPFRQHCRQVLARTSPRLSQLAQMDATLEDMLGERAQALLAKLSALLERRFHRYRQDAALSMAAFEQDFQDALVAELHFRLEPVTGLVEAWQTGT
ncbi:DUF3348 family protein [Rhodoferax mekongensis]|uniref:DUF3348 family protein n=1 Tax=Rhodoferax mekongensis TaxID=3068341 RepID=UPI0028BED1BA|nr:DUF3348 family protein [Rhodoferax sp. TBRC 17199]MDT7513709.1 DUF3348 family protein [Rhodoferax sp. TBRC 17199]